MGALFHHPPVSTYAGSPGEAPSSGSPVMGLGCAHGVSGEAPFLHHGRAGRTQHVGLNAEPLWPYASFLMLPVGLTPVLCSLGHLRGCLSSAPREGCLFPHPPLLSAVEGWSGWDAEKSITWGKGKIISFLTDRSDLSFKTPAGGKWHNLP